MRVLFYTAARAWSGSARAFAAAARGLAARGHQVTYVCPPDSPVEQHLDHTAYEVLPLPAWGPWPLAAWRLRRLLSERFVEVIFVHTEREQLAVAVAARWAERGAIVRRVPAESPVTLGPAARLALRLATTGWMFVSEDDRRAAPAEPLARLEPTVVPLGVDVAAYDRVRPASEAAVRLNAADKQIVCLYDSTSPVRAATALRVLGLLAPLHPELALVLVGPGSDSEDLRMHAAALGITERVRFFGERDDYLSVIRGADLGWVVSRGDGAAFGYLDLLALKVPVLAERSALSQQYVANGITGLLLPPEDTPETAAAVARLLAHEDERVAMGNAGRVRVARDFTEQEMVDGFERAGTAAGDRSLWRVT